MPGRPVTTGTEQQRSDQRSYRAKLRARGAEGTRGAPETDDLYRAVARVYRSWGQAMAKQADPMSTSSHAFDWFGKRVQRELVAAGFDRTESLHRTAIFIAPDSKKRRLSRKLTKAT